MIEFPKDPTETFTDGALVVEAYRGNDDRTGRSVYSVRVGKQVEKKNEAREVVETYVAPFIRVYQDQRSLAQVRLQAPFAAALTALLHRAEDWILEDMGRQHEMRLERMRERERFDTERGIRPVRRTGKTERDREKRRYRAREST